MNNANPTIYGKKQQGAALITALVLLVLVTMLALSSLSTTTMDERMAANSQEINRAFQAAEAGLSEVWNDADAYSTNNTPASDGTADDPYNKATDDVGGTDADVTYNSIYRQQTVPPRGSGWDSTMAYYHFDLTATGETASGAESRLHAGAYQVGRRQ